MANTHNVIYIPGIGDTKTTVQELAVGTWRLYGVIAYTFPMRWARKEPFESKFWRLLAFIDSKIEMGHDVSLVGASAGATVVINAFAARKDHINGAVCIAGKINHPETIGARYRKYSPSFIESAAMCQTSLATLSTTDRKRILSVYGRIDPIVPKRDSTVDGATNLQVNSTGHAMTIGTQLVFGAPRDMKFLKKLTLVK